MSCNIFADGCHHGLRVNACGPPLQPVRFSVDPVETVVVADPESSMSIAVDRIHPIACKIVGAGPAAKCFEGTRVDTEVIWPVAFEAHPNVSFPILSQRNDVIRGHAVRISGIVPITDEATPLSVQLQKA
jgi:hypothetical protein